MKRVYVKTSNTSKFLAAYDELGRRGAREACLIVAEGLPGLGKTTTIKWVSTQQGWIFLRAKEGWRPAWMLRELLAELKVQPAHSFELMYAQAIEALACRVAAADRADQTFAVVIDEIDHVCRRKEVMETIRDLSDMLEIPIVLVGMGKVRHGITRFPQIARRVGKWVEFAPATLEDARGLAAGLAEVPVADCMISYLHRASEGRVSEIMEGIGAIERFGRRNAGPVTVKAMAGLPLMSDRKSGQPILVRE